VLIFASLAGAVAGLTLLFLGMRGVMDIGGSCASGGPFVAARPCPDGTGPAVFAGIWGGVICLGIYAWLTLTRHVPGFLPLAWPALFLSLGYNFLQYGVDPPAGAPAGLDMGFLVCAVLFGVMGGAPLLIFVIPIARSLSPFGHPPAARPAPATRAGAVIAAALPGVRLPRAASTGPVAPRHVRPAPMPAPVAKEPGTPSPWPPPERTDADPAAIFASPIATASERTTPPPPAAASWATFESPPIPEDEPTEPPPPAPARDPRLELHPVFPPGSPLAMADAVEAAAAAGTAYTGDTIVTALERLASLHESGALTDDEFAAAKDRLLLGHDT